VNAWLNPNGKEVSPVGFLIIYLVAIVIIGAIVIGINIRLIRREKNESAEPAVKTSSAESQSDKTLTEPNPKTVKESPTPTEFPKAAPQEGVPSPAHDETVAPVKRTAAATAPTSSTPIFQRRSQQPAPLQQATHAERVRPTKARDASVRDKQDPFEMTDDDYRNALRKLSGLATSGKTPELDDEPMVTTDDAYREALRSMMNKKQDSC
jgi:cytoskeletal protein RodZ